QTDVTQVDFAGGNFQIDFGTLAGSGLYAVEAGTLSVLHVLFPTLVENLELDFAGTIDGEGDLLISNSFYWRGGTMRNTNSSGTTHILPRAQMTVDGLVQAKGHPPFSTSVTLDGRTLKNEGTTAWVGGDIYLLNNAALRNEFDGTFDIKTNNFITS